MERPFVRCVPPSAFLLPPPVPRLLLRWLCHLSPGKKDFILLLLCWRLQFKKILWTHQMHTHTHTLSCTHTCAVVCLTHTQTHTEKRQFHVQLLSRWHETTLKQEEARQQQRVWRGEGRWEENIAIGECEQSRQKWEDESTCNSLTCSWCCCRAFALLPPPLKLLPHVKVNCMCVWPVELTWWNSILQHSNCFQYNLLVRKINEHYLWELNPIKVYRAICKYR